MSWFQKMGRKLSGAEARDREARARQILGEHEARDHFGAQEALDRLTAEMPEEHAKRFILQHFRQKIEPVIFAALEDGLLSPDEEARIERIRERYGNIRLEGAIVGQLEAARAQFRAWSLPLEPVQVPLMLKNGEWCAHAVKAVAYEERQRAVRTNYAGPTARVRIMKGVYYRAGSIQTQRVTEAYQHSFGEGVLGATNKRLLWVSPQKSLSVPLDKVVMFEPFTDGIKIIKDTGKPLLFVFEGPDQASMVRISRVIEELR